MKFAFIEAHASVYAITTMCRVLEVSRTGYHAWVKRSPSDRAVEFVRELAEPYPHPVLTTEARVARTCFASCMTSCPKIRAVPVVGG